MPYSLKKLMDNARSYAMSEKWDVVENSVIPQLGNYRPSSVAAYLPSLFRSKNGNLRDLAGTLTAAINFSALPSGMKTQLKTDLQKELFSEDKNPFAVLRSAVALVHHKIYSPEDLQRIKSIMRNKQVLSDPDARKVAIEYSKRL